MPDIMCDESSSRVVSTFAQDEIYEGEGKVARFIPGLLSGVAAALLFVIFALLNMETMYGRLLVLQVNAQEECGDLLKLFHENQGHDLRAISLFQGIFGIFGGVLTLSAASFAMFRSPSTQGVQGKMDAVDGYRKELRRTRPFVRVDDQGQPVQRLIPNSDVEVGDEALNHRLEEIRDVAHFDNGERFGGRLIEDNAGNITGRRRMNNEEVNASLQDSEFFRILDGEQQNDLLRTFDEHFKGFREERSELIRTHSEKSNTLMTLSNTLGTLCNGVSGVGSAGYQNEQKTYEGQAAVSQSSLNLSQSISGQYHGNIDKRANEASAVVQTISAIGNANMIGQV